MSVLGPWEDETTGHLLEGINFSIGPVRFYFSTASREDRTPSSFEEEKKKEGGLPLYSLVFRLLVTNLGRW